jgi:hypothetical protein
LKSQSLIGARVRAHDDLSNLNYLWQHPAWHLALFMA